MNNNAFIHNFNRCVFVICFSVTLLSCDEVARKLGYKKIINVDSNTQSYQIQNELSSDKIENVETTISRSFSVNARVYHFVGTAYDGYDKATDRYEIRNIQVYSNGDIYSDGLPVRFSHTSGFDYECNRGNIIYKFNSSEIDEIL